LLGYGLYRQIAQEHITRIERIPEAKRRTAFRLHGTSVRSGTCRGFGVASERLSVVVLPLPRLASLADEKDGDDERGEGVGPPQTEHGVEGEPGEGRD